MARRRTHTESYWAKAGPELLRCTAKYRSGEQCRSEAWPGTNVCDKHGALIPVVQAKAATRIQMSADEAVKFLLGVLADPSTDNRDKIKVAHDLLDRGGLGAAQKHLIGVVSQDPVEKLFADILSDPRMLQQQPALPAEPDPELLALNAKVLEDDDDLDADDLLGPVVGAEIVEEEAPAPTFTQRPIAYRQERPRGRKPAGDPLPPEHIRKDLERLGLL